MSQSSLILFWDLSFIILLRYLCLFHSCMLCWASRLVSPFTEFTEVVCESPLGCDVSQSSLPALQAQSWSSSWVTANSISSKKSTLLLSSTYTFSQQPRVCHPPQVRGLRATHYTLTPWNPGLMSMLQPWSLIAGTVPCFAWVIWTHWHEEISLKNKIVMVPNKFQEDINQNKMGF